MSQSDQSYVFEFSRQASEVESSECWSPRFYRDDRQAVRAAQTMFRNRASDANDELAIYQGRKNWWGSAEGRYVGKIAYNALGTGTQFFSA